MEGSSNYSEATLEKITQFFDNFIVNPKQSALALCRKLKLSNSTVYTFCRQNQITLSAMRDGQDYSKKLSTLLNLKHTKQNSDEEIIKLEDTELVVPDIKMTLPSLNNPRTQREHMEDVVNKIDKFKNKGHSLIDSIKKANLSMHFSTYYTYRRNLNAMKKNEIIKHPVPVSRAESKTKRAYIKTTKEIPTIPHTIEYIEVKPEKKIEKKQDEQLVMMIGSPDMLLEFVKKMKGSQDE